MPSTEPDVEPLDGRLTRLRQQVETAEASLRRLKLQVQETENQVEVKRQTQQAQISNASLSEQTKRASDSLRKSPRDEITLVNTAGCDSPSPRWPLTAAEYQRYGRQMIMPEVGLEGQLRLRKAKVLIVGVGGLGCPAAVYLAGAGVGTLGLMDGDTVELSNLHRQVAHATTRVGMSKVESAFQYLQSLNAEVSYVRHDFHLSPEQAISIFEQYDLVLDCTDHPTSRYLISDACVLTGKSLVSASALKTEGQLIVLNEPPLRPGNLSGGPCYRCIFPKPPSAESVLSCGEGGILGPVVGVMGVLQALEAIKILTKQRHEPAETSASVEAQPVKASLLMFSAYSNPQFRTVRLRSRRADCAACSTHRTISADSLSSGSLDYVAFCGRTAPVNVLPSESRISAREFSQLAQDSSNVLIDVRDKTQYAICALPGSTNVPWTGNADSWLAKAQQSGALDHAQNQKYIVCRFGNDSQLAAKAILERPEQTSDVKDVTNGFQAWREEVDSSWPDY